MGSCAGCSKRPARSYCHNCNTKKTPQWRNGPQGDRTLCNACGLRYRKQLREGCAPDEEPILSLGTQAGPVPAAEDGSRSKTVQPEEDPTSMQQSQYESLPLQGSLNAVSMQQTQYESLPLQGSFNAPSIQQLPVEGLSLQGSLNAEEAQALGVRSSPESKADDEHVQSCGTFQEALDPTSSWLADEQLQDALELCSAQDVRPASVSAPMGQVLVIA